MSWLGTAERTVSLPWTGASGTAVAEVAAGIPLLELNIRRTLQKYKKPVSCANPASFVRGDPTLTTFFC